MKTIIAGSREFIDQDFVNRCVKKHIHVITEVVSGGAKGVDMLGEQFAKEHNLPIKRFSVSQDDWKTLGKAAGPIRNKKMAEYADALIAFWDGNSPGTKNMIETMKKMGKPFTVYDVHG